MDRNKAHNVNYKNKLKRLIVEKDGLITTKEVEELSKLKAGARTSSFGFVERFVGSLIKINEMVT